MNKEKQRGLEPAHRHGFVSGSTLSTACSVEKSLSLPCNIPLGKHTTVYPSVLLSSDGGFRFWPTISYLKPWGQMCFRILERQSILHNPPCKHQHSPVIKHINVSARKYMNIPHRNSFTSIQVGFCHRMNSGQIRLYLQIRDGKSLGFKAF